jgi:hypothetical protein
MSWFSLGDRIAGTYLKREVSGEIIDADFARQPHCITYTVKLDAPVKVTRDGSLLEFERRRLTLHLNEEGHSVDTKNRPDNIARMTKLEA